LEGQVSELKKRLEDLRKAKSQTIVKKDKEYVTASGPKLGQHQTTYTCSGQCKTSQEKEQHNRREIETLKEQIYKLKISHTEELETLLKCHDKSSESQLELTELRKKYKELEGKHESLEACNTEQRLRIEDLYELLSRKEAEWCDKEEKLKMELNLSWREKYQQWMVQTEQKIEELRAANDFL
ncbi:hypothetical protein QZH41_014946, partial [Actinostola sp. cb2023]